MANEEHFKILKQGAKAWNEWRTNNPNLLPDLSGAVITAANLSPKRLMFVTEIESSPKIGWREITMEGPAFFLEASADFSGVNFSGATLNLTDFSGADLREANLSRAHLLCAYLIEADLRGANLREADLTEANLSSADLSGADLVGANLTRTNLIETNFENADLSSCRIYGISAWNVNLTDAKQPNLIMTPPNEPTITVDNLEVAQFIYLLLHYEKIRDVIDTVARKLVLILGRFTPERKTVLNAIRDELRKHNYLPALFDFDKPATRDLTETIRTLAHLSRFIIADLSDPRSIPQELQAIVPDLAVPVQPLLESSQREYGMFLDFPKKYHWVLPTYWYEDLADLLKSLGNKVIAPAEAKATELEKR
jgi:hypothetical protein